MINNNFCASFSWKSSVILSTPINTGVRSRHVADDEIEDAVLWSADAEPVPVNIVDPVPPVDDVDFVVVIWRSVTPNDSIM